MESLMSQLASAALTQNLREANSRLGFWLDSLTADSHDSPPCAASPQQMAGLLSELMRTGEWLRRLPSEPRPELTLELSEYRRHVERLRGLLPSIYSTLLRERARLEQERARVESAAEWAQRSRQTL